MTQLVPHPQLPLLTAGLPGTGGRIRSTDADFGVVEIPQYEPSGDGDHTYLLIEKRGIPTDAACRRIADALGVPSRTLGYAGLKDAHAVTVQTISVEHVPPDEARRLLEDVDRIRLLDARRHGNKLRLGHLRGNRFDLIVRGVVPDGLPRAEAILDVLARRGCPNGFGPQRFGLLGRNHLVGRALVRRDAEEVLRLLLDEGPSDAGDDRAREAAELYRNGDLAGAADALPPVFRTERRLLHELDRGRSPERALRAIPRNQARLLVSAYQSALFNALLTARLPELDVLVLGDLAFLHDRGAVFRVDDPAAEQPRCDADEISPSGPLFGKKSKLATGAPGDAERELLASQEISLRDFSVPGAGRFDGARRPFRVPVEETSVEALEIDGEACLRLRFALPKGSYATSVLAEVCKT